VRQLRRTIWFYFGFQFFFGLLFWLPVFYEYQKQMGLSDAEIFRIQSIYYIAFCFLEIPTGMIADQMGRRRCMRAGAAVLVLSNLLPIFWPTYAGFLTHFLLIALARSFISGASSAYLYDLLERHEMSDEFKVIEGRARAYSLYGKVACWSVIGLLMGWHLTLPYWLTVGAALAAVGFSLALPYVETEEVGRLAPAMVWGRLREVGGWFRAQPFLSVVILQGVAAFVLARLVQVNLFQPVLEQRGFPVAGYGLVMALMTAFEAIGSARPRWIRNWLDDFRAVFVLSLVLAASMGALAPSGFWMTLVLLSFFAYVTGLLYPIQRQLINDVIPDSRHRATIMSLESIVDRAVNAWLAALIGGYLAGGRLDEYLLLSAGWTVAFLLALWAVSSLRVFRRPGPA
jgi:MFS family permease